jgi:hypothetical protein
MKQRSCSGEERRKSQIGEEEALVKKRSLIPVRNCH